MNKIPKYQHFKPRGIGCIKWQGRRIYFPGAFNSPESIKAYRRFIQDNCEKQPPSKTGKLAKPQAAKGMSLAELADLFLEHVTETFKGVKQTEYPGYRRILALLVEHYGELEVAEFGPKRLTEFQKWLAENDHPRHVYSKDGQLRKTTTYRLTRNSVNHMIGNIKRLFKWGVANEFVDPYQLVGLQAVPGLRIGRTTARESVPREPVSWEAVERVLPLLSPVVADMVRFQWHTGCRPQNVCNICPAEIDTTTSPWTWKPQVHKGNWRGQGLQLFIGPQAEAIIRPYLNRPSEEPCFCPREARRALRQAKGHKGECAFKYLNSRYTPSTYGRAIVHGLAGLARVRLKTPYSREKFLDAGIEYWTPHQLRHAKAQMIRDEFGLEAAQAVLGHNSLAATQIYAKKRLDLAKELATKCG
jgi:integrase